MHAGGMLASWMRLKYPHILDGAIAGSAPIWSYLGEHPVRTLLPCHTSRRETKNIQTLFAVRLNDLKITFKLFGPLGLGL